MLIYCSHKFGGKLENAKAAELKIKRLQLADPENTYVSPIHAFGFMYDTVSYEDGIDMCLDLLSKCGKMIVLSEKSKGVNIEIEYCKVARIPVDFLEGELWNTKKSATNTSANYPLN